MKIRRLVSSRLISSRLVSSRLLFSSLLVSCLVLSCPFLILSYLVFASSWGSCGVIFNRLGGLLGSFLVVLGVVLGILGALGASFWGSWAVFGRLESVLKAVDGIKSAQTQQGPFHWRPNAGFELQLGPPRGSQNDPKTNKNRSKNRLEKRSRFRTVLRSSWGDLGPILAPSWGHFY